MLRFSRLSFRSAVIIGLLVFTAFAAKVSASYSNLRDQKLDNGVSQNVTVPARRPNSKNTGAIPVSEPKPKALVNQDCPASKLNPKKPANVVTNDHVIIFGTCRSL